MKLTKKSKFPRMRSSEKGVALIVTLAVLVLATMAAVAFFSRATGNRLVEASRSNQIQSEQLVRSGVEYVIGKFISNITSTNNSTAITVGNSTIYRPKTQRDMIPTRDVNGLLAADAQFNNLVLQSLNGTSTSDPAPGGRAITMTSWNAPMLLGGDGFINNSTVPSWVYLNRDGSTSSTPSDASIGRFAYNAYNLGGLLDINAFGHGGNFSATDAQTKGTPASAVLGALPGISATATKSNNSLSWPPTWRIPGDWGNMTYDPASDPSSPLKYYMNSGWRVPFAENGMATHRFFNSRQDLIRFAKANPSTFTVNGTQIPALQYLTHWSRDVDLPTHEPPAGRPKVLNDLAAGGNDAYGMDDDLNPSLLTVTNLGNTPSIKKRFPLSRLSMVSTPVPPAAPSSSPAALLKYFGLTWDSGNNRWVYDHGDPSDILPLSDIPADREPDFFELLKAAISVGSLGKQFGIPFPPAYSSLGFPAQKGGTDGSVNYQLIQIAANIIDQYDADGYPTRIHFDGREFYGVEDHPRLHLALDRTFRVGDSSTDYVSGFASPQAKFKDAKDANGNITQIGRTWASLDMILWVWMVQAQLWNPHDIGTTGKESLTPENFRIIANSHSHLGVEGSWFWKAGPYTTNPPIIEDIRDYSYVTDLRYISGPDCTQSISYNGSQYIAFKLNDKSIFREPTFISQVGYPNGSNSVGFPNNPDMKMSDKSAPNVPDTVVGVYFNDNLNSPVLDPSQSLSTVVNPKTAMALGFVVGYMPGRAGGPQWGAMHKATGGPLSLELQYSAGGAWWTIDRQQLALTPIGRNYAQNIFMANRVDPRSDRFGSFYIGAQANAAQGIPGAYLIPYQFRNFSITSNPTPNLYSHLGLYTGINSANANIAPGWTGIGTSAAPGRLQRNSVVSDPFRYMDPDGVQRRGVAAYASDTSSAGWPMNSSNTSAAYNPTYNPASRPIVLNRSFRSIAELGNVFRGTPWRNLDFMTPESGDRVLLDLFTLEESPPDNVVGGRVNLNLVSKPVLSALIQGAGMADSVSTISNTTANEMADEYLSFINGTDSGEGYLKDRSEIVGRWVSGTSYAGIGQEMAFKLSDSQKPIYRNRHAIVASLADVGTVRTWNVLIDLIAQSGSVVNGQFIPQGESRIWECVSIDRFTAEIVARSSEPVRN